MSCIGLRYFNVFGPRQDPNGAYAAVIPLWIAALIKNQNVYINGDGDTTRDFCYVENVIQANVLAAFAASEVAVNQVYNVALSDRTSLLQLYRMMCALLESSFPHIRTHQPKFQPFRAGDIRHSQADISKARQLLGYAPEYKIDQGLQKAMDWYKSNLAARP